MRKRIKGIKVEIDSRRIVKYEESQAHKEIG
jgi:hypothetical protein